MCCLVGDLDWFAAGVLLVADALPPPFPPFRANIHTRWWQSPIAIRYNDKSVLEHHHCCFSFAVLDKFAILDNLTREQYKQLRTVLV